MRAADIITTLAGRRIAILLEEDGFTRGPGTSLDR